jgi:hypothetical protein
MIGRITDADEIDFNWLISDKVCLQIVDIY